MEKKTMGLLWLLVGLAGTACDKDKSAESVSPSEPAAAKSPASADAKADEGDTKPTSSPDEVTCAAFAEQLVKLLSEQGEQAILKEKDVPGLTTACETSEALDKEKETVACTMEATGLQQAQGCRDLNRVLKGLMAKM